MNRRNSTGPSARPKGANMSAPLNRRDFLIKSGLFGLGAASLPAFLAACGGTDSSTSSSAAGGGANELFFENWPLYIDDATVANFQKATGIAMKYTEAYNDNNEYFAKVQPLLAKGEKIAPDLVAPTFWMAARWVQLGWAQKLPLDRIPNAANLRDDLKSPSWNPDNEYSLPWQTGIAGIAYNTKATGRELNSANDLFDPAFKGRIGMLTEMRDTVGVVAMAMGKKISDVKTFDEVGDVFDKIEGAKKDGQIRAFTGNEYVKDLSAGNFAACIAWSGDVLQLTKDNPDVKFIVPEEGGTSWYDTMVWVKGSANSDSVAKWIDYVYDPANAALITASVQYISPVKGVQEELRKLGGDAAKLADDPLLFPTQETFARLQSWGPLPDAEEAKFDEAFASITGA